MPISCSTFVKAEETVLCCIVPHRRGRHHFFAVFFAMTSCAGKVPSAYITHHGLAREPISADMITSRRLSSNRLIIKRIRDNRLTVKKRFPNILPSKNRSLASRFGCTNVRPWNTLHRLSSRSASKFSLLGVSPTVPQVSIFQFNTSSNAVDTVFLNTVPSCPDLPHLSILPGEICLQHLEKLRSTTNTVLNHRSPEGDDRDSKPTSR